MLPDVRGSVSRRHYSGGWSIDKAASNGQRNKDLILQEEFESHVVEHFSYEESETLRNFDTVPDAYWPGIEHDPEM